MGTLSPPRSQLRVLLILGMVAALLAAVLVAALNSGTTTAGRPAHTGLSHWKFTRNAQGTIVKATATATLVSDVNPNVVAQPDCTTAADTSCNPRLTPSGVIAVYTGATFGPSSYTDNAVAKISSYTKHTRSSASSTDSADSPEATKSKTYWTAKITESCPKCAATPANSNGQMTPDSWYNPGSWNWSGIFGGAWNNVIKPCLNGVTLSTGVTYGGSAATKAMYYMEVRGVEAMDVTPTGLAVTLIGSCGIGIARANS